MDINLNDLLRRYKSHPFEDYKLETPHTGTISFKVRDGQPVKGPSGKWLHRPGSLLYVLEREKNPKRIYAPCNGEVAHVRMELDGRFVEAGEEVLSIRHRLGKEEIIDRILTQVLYIFEAPQRARFFLAPETATKIERKSSGSVSVVPGDEILIMSLMKRDTMIAYSGEPGVIYKVYFKSGDLVEQGDPLLGICSPEKLPYVNKVIQRIKTEWED